MQHKKIKKHYIHLRTVERIKERYNEGGIKRALYDAPRPGQKQKYTSKDKAEIIAIVCSDAPKGYER